MIKDATGTDENVHCMQLDVCDKERIAERAAEAERVFGDVNIIINNAGVV
jgi:NADP-dependent 3-hydroxy acid dehydrogenase YdfG